MDAGEDGWPKLLSVKHNNGAPANKGAGDNNPTTSNDDNNDGLIHYGEFYRNHQVKF